MPTSRPPRDTADRLARAFALEFDQEVAELAVEMGLLTEDRLAEAGAEADETGQSPLTVVVARGWLDVRTVAALRERLARRDEAAEARLVAEAPELPVELHAAAADPSKAIGNLILVELLGRGGSADIWKAWDRGLARWVAVKISIAAIESEAARVRFERESRAVARLSHPHIVPIHASGVDRGRPYLVMPFVDGETLDRLQLSARRACEIVRSAAQAIEYAHGCGVIHRDLKPHNLMLDRQGRVMVLDFGLVHVRGERQGELTTPGDVLGTAGFMSPEQTRAGDESRRPTTDVYGLGATLYFLVTGRAPFQGSSLAEVVARIVNEESDPPRKLRPDLDGRVEAVILKAIERDPARRYPTAAAFADDLGRVLEDRDTNARPRGWGRRFAAFARRRRAPVIAAVALLVFIGVVAGARWRIEREAAARIEAVRDLARTTLDTALRLRRAGDITGMRQVLPGLVGAYERMRGRARDMVEVEYLMGRMYRALMNDPEALRHQERALAADPNYLPALYERTVLASKSYGRALTRAQSQTRVQAGGADEASISDASAVERGRSDLTPLRTRILDDCARIEAHGGGSVEAEAARGIVAHYRQRYGEARERLERAVTRDPLREEAWELLARTAERQLLTPGVDDVTFRNLLGQAESALSAALTRDRGYLPHWVERCRLRQQLGFWAEAHPGLEPRNRRDYLALAAADASQALGMDSEDADAHACRGEVTAAQASIELEHGGNPVALLDGALADLAKADAAAASAPDIYLLRGRAFRDRAIVAARTGEDPLRFFAASDADMSRAIAVDPGGDYWTSRGRTRARRGMFLWLRREDARPDLTAAIADFTEAIRLAPKKRFPWRYRAEALAQRALDAFERGDGRSVDDDFTSAEHDFAQAGALLAVDVWRLVGRGTARTWRGRTRIGAGGGDPLADWKAAADDLAEALRIDARVPAPWLAEANLRIERAGYLRKQGAPGRGDLEVAARDLDVAARMDPEDAEIWLARGDLARVRGDASGAEAAYRRGLALNPFLDRQIKQRLGRDLEAPRR